MVGCGPTRHHDCWHMGPLTTSVSGASSRKFEVSLIYDSEIHLHPRKKYDLKKLQLFFFLSSLAFILFRLTLFVGFLY
jgi:hypothetical protein